MGTNIYGCLKQLFLLKKRNRNLKVLLSVGGWTYSGNFKTPAASAEGRRTFAESVVGIVEDCGFDGVDIDWEYPADDIEAQNYVLLLKETRKALDRAASKREGDEKCHFLLTIACPAGPQHYEKLRIREMDPYLDFWNLMAYDYAGGWDQRAGHQSNLYPDCRHPECTPFSTDAAVRFYTEKGGVQPGKIVLGMPLYGRAFTDTKGPGHRFSGTGEGSWENGVWDYKTLPRPGSVVHEEDCDGHGDEGHGHGEAPCGATWSFDPKTKVMVSYDTPKMVERKARYVREMGLGGGMWWESSGDKTQDEAEGKGASLVETFIKAVGGRCVLEESRNCLHYPESKYDNLRKGFPGEGEE